MCNSRIRPFAHVALRLPSGAVKVVEVAPNTIISIGKYGNFAANLIIGRPYNLTFEILDREPDDLYSALRVVPASEIHAEHLSDAASTPSEPGLGETRLLDGGDGVMYELVGDDGEVVMRSNRGTIDDPARQKMTMDEIEQLKREGTGAGKDLISKLLLSHSALDQKTSFSLAKYTLRKTKKYMRRFTVLALDIPTLANYLIADKEPMKIMELREEMLSLIGSWANVHYTPEMPGSQGAFNLIGGGKWLVIDETGGLLLAAMAERMGVLHPDDDPPSPPDPTAPTPRRHTLPGMSAHTNTLTLLHSNAQPNATLLRFFGFDISNPAPSHPLHTRLKALSWLQLLHPTDDASAVEPTPLPSDVLASMKSSKRGTYYRKRRRWERIQSVITETRAGGFDGLVVASVMNHVDILRHLVPLLRGGAQIAIYSPYVQPLVELADLYSTPRRTAYKIASREERLIEADFPLDPTLLLAPMIQTSKLRQWQCLPGRTHPLMTARGGAEGYLFTATRVLPAEGKVEARGKFKRRKQTVSGEQTSNGTIDPEATALVKEEEEEEEDASNGATVPEAPLLVKEEALDEVDLTDPHGADESPSIAQPVDTPT